VEVPKELQKAAAHGDVRENAEYKAAKERQEFLRARIAQLRSRIDSLSSLRLEEIPRGSGCLWIEGQIEGCCQW